MFIFKSLVRWTNSLFRVECLKLCCVLDDERIIHPYKRREFHTLILIEENESDDVMCRGHELQKSK